MDRTLSRADLRAALEVVGAISECASSDGQFARHGVACLGKLVAADLVTLSACNLATGRRRVVSDVPGAIAEREIAAFDRHFHEHPLVRAHGRNAGAVTHRISDLVDAGDFHASDLYNEYYRAIGIDHALAVPIHVHRNELVSFVLNRSRRDFSDRDVACLELVRVHLGNLFRLGREVADARAAWGVPAEEPIDDAAPLTAREREVIGWLAAGKPDRDIADILGISRRTVHKHLQRIYEKLGVETRTAALSRWMSRRG